ncbi:MAG: c-type cytochrome [Candidatus Thiodiazotropha lotti]|uniref:C-type cytochrome n=1 Tax=Candidatus Thiodiazotropha lotti TaxID=2792787 RepID=A0A9E4K603_9GAMM|nr:c-type cytochrome [Candidatus Thiodiazotropha lotti]MCG7939461.1 c-type cytochrome [Candidatus Thiodiazotropha lotti]MCW4203934.1 c-type cytochrome [Candidatus Thiodiazotropha lotti]
MRKFILVASLVSMLTPALSVAQPADDALREYEQAMNLTPNLANGKKVYKICAVCHTPEGWGLESGAYPQVAGQLSTVLIKQLADIRARNRDNPTMLPFTSPQLLGGAQEIADVAAYISQLPMSPHNGVGPGVDLALGEHLYKDNCVECHGEHGEGILDDHIPLIYGQHYRYLLRQFEWIKNERRRNADKKMVKQIHGFTHRDIRAVLDYVSRIKPPKEKLAEPGWHNPDFPKFARPPNLHSGAGYSIDKRPARPTRP